ncbi:MAG: hypothetical protein WBY94_09325 [Polyangiaceae bacterium]
MSRELPAALVVSLAWFSGACAILGCNSVLGIERATLETSEAGVEAGGDPTGGEGPLTCDNYCAVMMQNCTGEYLEYLSNDVCMTLCGYMTQGQFYPLDNEPENVDTLGCRLWHAHSAAAHPEVHCRHAGPLGADLCGGPCEPFCSLDWHYCTDDNGLAVYDGQVTGCEAVCASDGGLPYVEVDSGDLADPSGNMIVMGNTLNCRLWHLETAISIDMPTTHCPHTGPQSATCQ